MDQATKDEIVGNFNSNVARVRSLIDVYDAIGTAGPGRPTIAQTDVLRAAIVLLHASLEDLLRSSSEQLLPLAEPDVLNQVGFPRADGANVERFKLGELARFRGDQVDDVLRAAVATKLQRSNYNNVNEIGNALERIRVGRDVLSPDESKIEAMIKRRHLIVHRADKDPTRRPRRGATFAQHLPKATVEDWLSTITAVGRRIGAALPVDG